MAGERIHPKAKGRIKQLFAGPIVNHTSCYPGFVGREVGLVSVLGGRAYLYVTHGWIRVVPPSGPGVLPSARRLYIFLSIHDRISIRNT
jgi:hypothetical protein